MSNSTQQIESLSPVPFQPGLSVLILQTFFFCQNWCGGKEKRGGKFLYRSQKLSHILTFPESQLIPKRLSLSALHMAFAPPTSPHVIGPAQDSPGSQW